MRSFVSLPSQKMLLDSQPATLAFGSSSSQSAREHVVCVSASESHGTVAVWATNGLHLCSNGASMQSIARLDVASISEQGSFNALLWRPDGKRLALVSERQIVIVAIDGKQPGSRKGVMSWFAEAESDEDEDDASLQRIEQPTTLRIVSTVTAEANDDAAVFTAATATGAFVLLAKRDGRIAACTWAGEIVYEVDGSALVSAALPATSTGRAPWLEGSRVSQVCALTLPDLVLPTDSATTGPQPATVLFAAFESGTVVSATLSESPRARIASESICCAHSQAVRGRGGSCIAATAFSGRSAEGRSSPSVLLAVGTCVGQIHLYTGAWIADVRRVEWNSLCAFRISPAEHIAVHALAFREQWPHYTGVACMPSQTILAASISERMGVDDGEGVHARAALCLIPTTHYGPAPTLVHLSQPWLLEEETPGSPSRCSLSWGYNGWHLFHAPHGGSSGVQRMAFAEPAGISRLLPLSGASSAAASWALGSSAVYQLGLGQPASSLVEEWSRQANERATSAGVASSTGQDYIPSTPSIATGLQTPMKSRSIDTPARRADAMSSPLQTPAVAAKQRPSSANGLWSPGVSHHSQAGTCTPSTGMEAADIRAAPLPSVADAPLLWTRYPVSSYYVPVRSPLRLLAVTSDGSHLAVAGTRGAAVLAVNSRQWHVFSRPRDERAIHAVALAWLGNRILFVLSERGTSTVPSGEPSHRTYELHAYPRARLGASTRLACIPVSLAKDEQPIGMSVACTHARVPTAAMQPAVALAYFLLLATTGPKGVQVHYFRCTPQHTATQHSPTVAPVYKMGTLLASTGKCVHSSKPWAGTRAVIAAGQAAMTISQHSAETTLQPSNTSDRSISVVSALRIDTIMGHIAVSVTDSVPMRPQPGGLQLEYCTTIAIEHKELDGCKAVLSIHALDGIMTQNGDDKGLPPPATMKQKGQLSSAQHPSLWRLLAPDVALHTDTGRVYVLHGRTGEIRLLDRSRDGRPVSAVHPVPLSSLGLLGQPSTAVLLTCPEDAQTGIYISLPATIPRAVDPTVLRMIEKAYIAVASAAEGGMLASPKGRSPMPVPPAVDVSACTPSYIPGALAYGSGSALLSSLAVYTSASTSEEPACLSDMPVLGVCAPSHPGSVHGQAVFTVTIASPSAAILPVVSHHGSAEDADENKDRPVTGTARGMQISPALHVAWRALMAGGGQGSMEDCLAGAIRSLEDCDVLQSAVIHPALRALLHTSIVCPDDDNLLVHGCGTDALVLSDGFHVDLQQALGPAAYAAVLDLSSELRAVVKSGPQGEAVWSHFRRSLHRAGPRSHEEGSSGRSTQPIAAAAATVSPAASAALSLLRSCGPLTYLDTVSSVGRTMEDSHLPSLFPLAAGEPGELFVQALEHAQGEVGSRGGHTVVSVAYLQCAVALLMLVQESAFQHARLQGQGPTGAAGDTADSSSLLSKLDSLRTEQARQLCQDALESVGALLAACSLSDELVDRLVGEESDPVRLDDPSFRLTLQESIHKGCKQGAGATQTSVDDVAAALLFIIEITVEYCFKLRSAMQSLSLISSPRSGARVPPARGAVPGQKVDRVGNEGATVQGKSHADPALPAPAAASATNTSGWGMLGYITSFFITPDEEDVHAVATLLRSGSASSVPGPAGNSSSSAPQKAASVACSPSAAHEQLLSTLRTILIPVCITVDVPVLHGPGGHLPFTAGPTQEGLTAVQRQVQLGMKGLSTFSAPVQPTSLRVFSACEDWLHTALSESALMVLLHTASPQPASSPARSTTASWDALRLQSNVCPLAPAAGDILLHAGHGQITFTGTPFDTALQALERLPQDCSMRVRRVVQVRLSDILGQMWAV